MSSIAAVIECKTYFKDIAGFRARRCFDHENQATAGHLGMLGPKVRKFLLMAASEPHVINTMHAQANGKALESGLQVFALSQLKTGSQDGMPVYNYLPVNPTDDIWPLQRFLAAIDEGVRAADCSEAGS